MNEEQENIFQEFWLQGHDRDWNGHVGSVDIHKMADEIIKLRQQTSVLRGLLIELTDEDDCRYDHHGYCQAHSLDTAPCPHSRSRTLIKEMYL
jgi:uncharacterized protein CbrC (UPF0167 family)